MQILIDYRLFMH